MRCEAPIVFSPGAGSRLCPFCGAVNLVREQQIATPPLELKIDEIFRMFQNGQLQVALDSAERLIESATENYRLSYYRACILKEKGQLEDAIYALIDLSGIEAPAPLRADAQATLASCLLAADRQAESLQAAQRCLDLQDGHPAGCMALAIAKLQAGQAAEALKLTQDTIARLDRNWRITFPPRRHELLMLQANILGKMDRHNESADTLEDLLLTDTAAGLDAVRRSAKMLGRNYLAHARSSSAALELLRLAAMLDPENRDGMLDDLRDAAGRAGAPFALELENFKQGREELLAEIRSVLIKEDSKRALRPDLITPDLDLTLLGPDPDRRTDLLERAAERMQLPRFDRATLYPLRNIEDFRRWTVAWRLRELTKRLRRNKMEIARIEKLKVVRDQVGTPASRRKGRSGHAADEVGHGRWWKRLLVLLAIGLLLAGVFLVIAGDRFLDEFEGTLIKVDCLGADLGPPCSLHVASGETGRKRFRARHLERTWLAKIWRNWLDGRVQADGTILYPLDFPWSDLDARSYQPCVGRPIAKMQFTLAPLCNLPGP
jgi:tetratricopeptide (TPR) repeat protein